MRKLWLALALNLLIVGHCFAAEGAFRVTLLGTGTPVPSAERFSYSTLVEAGDQKLLFDFGRGVAIRLTQLHIPLGSITASFLTHFHSDHLVGLPDLWLTGWLRPPYGRRNRPFVLYGPKGTLALTKGLTEAFTKDRDIREADEHDPPSGIAFEVHEIEPGVVYEKEGVKVTAFANDHGPLVKPSFGYRIDYEGHSVVLSGDTRFDEAVVAEAKGVDLFVHCATLIPAALLQKNPAYQAVFRHLASPEDAGRAFAEAHPKLAVFSHIGLNGGSTVADLVAATRKTYQGPLVVGEDLMAFDIGDNIAVFERGR
jgi:ribonuclease Z